jgi:phosphoribosylformimino-5-aminoimidazole carboxamide ribotide isomerase
MRILPAIDLKGGQCVRLVEGRKDRATVYDGDPLAVARRWVRGGAEWIHVVDLDGAFAGQKTAHRAIAARIATRTGASVQFGGGIRSAAEARELLGGGVSRVVVGTLAVREPEAVAGLLAEFGDRVAIGLDARDGMILVGGWEEATGIMAADLARTMVTRGARRFIYTDVARDGTLTGPNLAATRLVAEAAGVPVTASGGVATLDDLSALRAVPGVDEAIVGKALYEGRFTLEEAIFACR